MKAPPFPPVRELLEATPAPKLEGPAPIPALEKSVSAIGHDVVDPDLDEIGKAFEGAPLKRGTGKLSSGALSNTRQQHAENFKVAANQARKLREKHKADPGFVAEAKRLEGKALYNAILAGDEDPTLESRGELLVQELVGDSRIPIRSRLELLDLQERAKTQKYSTDVSRLKRERLRFARELISDFPEESMGYEKLLEQGENTNDFKYAAELGGEVLRGKAPGAIRRAAQILIDRHALNGLSLLEIAEDALGATNVVGAAKGKMIVLYTWVSWSPGSVAAAKDMMRLAPEKVALFGLNLDTDTATASALATEQLLPGEQIYNSLGRDAPFPHALAVGTSFPVILANEDGVIYSIVIGNTNITKQVREARRQ